jgi:hypothetical protein
MSTLGFTVDDHMIDGKYHAYCHHCALTMRRTSDPVGLLLAMGRHMERRHGF